MHDDVTDGIGRNVRAEMARAGVSSRQLAAALGLNRGQIWRRLNGEVSWRADDLVRVAEVLGVPVAEFYEQSRRKSSA